MVYAGFALSATGRCPPRTHTALARLEQQTNSPSAIVFASQSGGVRSLTSTRTKQAAGVKKRRGVWDLVLVTATGAGLRAVRI